VSGDAHESQFAERRAVVSAALIHEFVHRVLISISTMSNKICVACVDNSVCLNLKFSNEFVLKIMMCYYITCSMKMHKPTGQVVSMFTKTFPLFTCITPRKI